MENIRFTWKTTINVPAAIPAEVVEKLTVLRDFMADKNGNVSKKFATVEAEVANRLCEAQRESTMALDRAFKKVLDQYVF